MKKVPFIIGLAILLTGMLAGCVQPAVPPEEERDESLSDLILVGFSQVGAESEWRVANSESMKSALSEENGYELIFDDARNE